MDIFTNVRIGEGVENIGANAFYGCTNLTDITISDSVTVTGYSALAQTGIETLTLPRHLAEIDTNAFYDCKALTSIRIPDSVKVIAQCAFKDCENLAEVHLPENLTEIGANAFRLCRSLKRVEIPDSVTKIRARAFSACDNLEEVTLPENITELGESVFNIRNDYYDLKNVYRKMLMKRGITGKKQKIRK